MPEHDIGVVILANADEKATYLQAIVLRVLNDVLGAMSVPLESTRYASNASGSLDVC